jgi:hypothetical protein
VKGNWLASTILDRMKSQPKKKKDSKERKAVFRTQFTSTGHYLELSCHRDSSRASCRHRFYITEDLVGFDVLLGTDLPRTSSAKVWSWLQNGVGHVQTANREL